jgi:hypothetical protein
VRTGQRFRGLVLAVGGRPALFVDRHVLLSPSVYVSRVSLVACGCFV